MWIAEQRPCDRQALLFAAGDFHAAFADHCIEALVCSRKKGVSGSLVQDSEALGVGSVRVDELQIFPDRAREQLSVLRNEPDPLP